MPEVNVKKNARVYDVVSKALRGGLVASATPVGRGGLGAALAKAAIAGQLGVNADLSRLPGNAKAPDSILFSESQGRILVSVRPDARKEFEKACKGIAFTNIGSVAAEQRVVIKLPKETIKMPLSKLTESYRKPFKNW